MENIRQKWFWYDLIFYNEHENCRVLMTLAVLKFAVLGLACLFVWLFGGDIDSD